MKILKLGGKLLFIISIFSFALFMFYAYLSDIKDKTYFLQITITLSVWVISCFISLILNISYLIFFRNKMGKIDLLITSFITIYSGWCTLFILAIFIFSVLGPD
jgi:hypothetical protein